MGLTDIIAQITLYFLDNTGNTLKKEIDPLLVRSLKNQKQGL